jgi:uncharacterized NAD(P)/FAD-binding protein YdhS
MTRPAPVVGVVGGGLAGALTATHLLRFARSPLQVIVVERRGELGRGIAYSTDEDAHLLNVPMERMSAFCDQPSHFADWATVHTGHPQAPGAYLPRRLYGDYVQDVLAEQERFAQGGRLERIAGDVVDLCAGDRADAVEMVLSTGRRVACDRVVLALGNLAPPRPSWLIEDPRVIADPWARGAFEGCDEGTTLLVGTGLTAVDVALSLCRPGAQGKLVAVSGGGKLPFAQLPGRREHAPPPRFEPGPLSLADVRRRVRDHSARMESEGYDWRDVIDGLRPQISDLWRRLPPADRRRFVDVHSRAWELRRHRMAPEVAARVGMLRSEGRLSLMAGRVIGARSNGDAIEVELGPGTGARKHRDRPASPRTLTVDRVVACTGPCSDIAQTPDPLVRRLLATGWAAPDALGLGLCCGPRGELLNAAGRTHEHVYALGPLLRGELWETTAAGEIRTQAEQLASVLCATLGVARPGWVETRLRPR